MASNLRVEPSREEDIGRIMELNMAAFHGFEYMKMTGDTPENIEAAGQRHIHAWREQTKHSAVPMGIKCVHTDPSTGKETIISSAEWLFYEQPRTEAEYTTPTYLFSAAWVDDTQIRSHAQEWIKPLLDKRIEWLGGRPYAALIYMVTDPAFHRLGAASMCVRWGLERCAAMGIPAILEASDAGAPVYKKLGFEEVDRVSTGLRGQEGAPAPVMIWWPKDTREEDKKPALPGYTS